ncbi:hypothetical protein [Mesorhizobium sp. M7A.F.Ca.ET.027.03.2.1]|uniref:hypothetical protein n=1 Tax=Mesorhizobium sp. M7A.F.Ca.ET.027.03.2.1 TaxID=2496656 RepID=UPI000FCA3AFC|nr:hypothetical protein [Mesorhizobium sp. M7A.F.Ca.ET.027.03.2.1]RVD65358.1 hypothetical protein EN750_08430 [Mesorhizobium sp. M7A.F.Ca.ET.027.03.2.1]
MAKGGNPSNNHDGEFIVSGPGTENTERFKQALSVSFAEQTATSMNYFKQSDPNDEGQISALGEAKIDYLKAQSGCYWTEETEKWTRAKLKRFADRNDRKRILGNSFDRSEMVVLPRRKDGAMPMEMRQLQGDPYEYFHFWPGTFGNYKYSWFNRTGDDAFCETNLTSGMERRIWAAWYFSKTTAPAIEITCTPCSKAASGLPTLPRRPAGSTCLRNSSPPTTQGTGGCVTKSATATPESFRRPMSFLAPFQAIKPWDEITEATAPLSIFSVGLKGT